MENFIFRLIVKHPSLALDEISSGVGLSPSQGHSVGEARTTPKGRVLDGVHKESFWGITREVNGRRDFFRYAEEFIGEISDGGKCFIRNLKLSGGAVIIAIDIANGSENIGDVLRVGQMLFFNDMNIEVGVEFFP